MIDLRRKTAFQMPPANSGGVLIVDREKNNRTILGLYFHQQGNSFWLAEDEAGALRILEDHRDEIGLVLLDVDTPSEEPAETLARLREIKSDIACFLMTGEWTPHCEAQEVKLGADGLIVKPLLFQALNVIVETCFAHA